MDILYQPKWTGFDALNELGQVDWSQVEHCYGKGVVPLGLEGDVSRSLAALRIDHSQAMHALYSNICHQGTVYQATAHAVPYIAAVAAGNVPYVTRTQLLALLGDISIGGSYVAPRGSHTGALGKDADVLVTESIAASIGRLATIRTPKLVALIQAIQELLVESTDGRRASVESAIDAAITPLTTP
ncbi:hypothetical protein [Arthrobacter sp. NicSoilB11]|jgi:hypothetical protein|uniref:hypothetical protein n=1 Tax=Arthrobacter sp. NicSoilB11 TaxID=2830999 RepID=UPI001CC77CBF|nr:hypothetical protein [Arthrobacter sp. NicSoilB11]